MIKIKTEKEKEILKKHGISPTTLSMEEKYPEYSPSEIKPDPITNFNFPEGLKFLKIINEIKEEVLKATNKFPPFHNSHEGIAVIREEYLELEQEVFKNQYKYPERIPNMRAEAIQLGSMAIRLILDICDNPNSWENSIHPKPKPVMEYIKKESEIDG